MAAYVVQERCTENNGGTTYISLAFSNNVTAHSAIHAMSGYGYESTLSQTYSDGTNSYTSDLDNVDDGAANRVAQGYALNCAAGATTVTVTCGGAGVSFLGIWIKEIGGCATDAIDAHNGASVAFTSGVTNGIALTTTAANALVSGLAFNANAGALPSNQGSWTAGSPSAGSTVWKDNNGVACAATQSQHFTSAGSKTTAFQINVSDAVLCLSMAFADTPSTISFVTAPTPGGTASGTSASTSSFTPQAGDAGIAFSSVYLAQTIGFSGNGSYAVINPPSNWTDDGGNGWAAGSNLNLAASSQVITASVGSNGFLSSVGVVYRGVGSISDGSSKSTGSTTTPAGNAVTVPAGSRLIAICGSINGSSGAPSSPYASPSGGVTPDVRYQGTVTDSGLICVVADYIGNGNSITPTFKFTSSDAFAIEQFILNPVTGGTNLAPSVGAASIAGLVASLYRERVIYPDVG